MNALLCKLLSYSWNYSITKSNYCVLQVSNLQDRIEGIESMSDVSLSSHIVQFPDLENSGNMYKKQPNAKRYYSHDDLYQTVSSQTTPQKSTDKLRLSSLPNTPIAARFTPKKNTVKFSPPHQVCKSKIGNIS